MVSFVRSIIGIIGLIIGLITDGLILLTIPTVAFGILTIFFQLIAPLYAWVPGCHRHHPSSRRNGRPSTNKEDAIYTDTTFLSELFYQSYRTYTSIVISLFLTYVSFLLEYVYNIDFVCYGLDRKDSSIHSKRSTTKVDDKIVHMSELRSRLRKVFISNHRTRLDWAMLWPVLLRTNYITSNTVIPSEKTKFSSSFMVTTSGGGFRALMELSIILKEDLKYLPFIGWGTQCSRYIFLQRNWLKDENHMIRMLQLLYRPSFLFTNSISSTVPSSLTSRYSILLFPEGTDLAPSNIVKSEKFCKDKNIVFYQQILHPRTKGFLHVVNTLVKNETVASMDMMMNSTGNEYPSRSISCTKPSDNSLDVIYDITMAYEGTIPQTEKSLVTGKVPRKVHVYIRPYDIQKSTEVSASSSSSLSNNEFTSTLSDGTRMDSVPAMENWLLARFAEKEHSLTNFYKQGNTPSVMFEPSIHTPSKELLLSSPGPTTRDSISCRSYSLVPRPNYWSTTLLRSRSTSYCESSSSFSSPTSGVGIPIVLYLFVTIFHIIVFISFGLFTWYRCWSSLGYTVFCFLLWIIGIVRYGKGMDNLESHVILRGKKKEP